MLVEDLFFAVCSLNLTFFNFHLDCGILVLPYVWALPNHSTLVTRDVLSVP
jgi:hypothetical protein